MALTINPITGKFDVVSNSPLAVTAGGTGLTTIAAGSILAANSANTLTAITSTSGLKAAINNAGTISWNTSTGTGNSVFDTAPTFVTSITAPTVYGSSAASGNLVLQSTSNSTRGTVQVSDLMQTGTSAATFSAAGFYLDVGTGNATVSSTGAVTALRFAATITATSNGNATGIVALFNAQYTLKDDGTARTLQETILFSGTPTMTATVASGLTLSDLAGIPSVTTIYHSPTFNRTGSGTGTATSVAGLHISNNASVGTGWTVTNYIGVLIDKPGGAGTVTNFYGVKNNGAAATNNWFLYETGGMQSSHKGRLRLGDNTAPTAILDVQGSINTNQTTANGSVATAMSSVGPTGSHTTIQEWLTITINGTTRYIPCF